ncbi:hypothetical protein E2562_007268 [Oryza meyeriana var. granulata]|uniref:Pentatricopeptide repeat-containing protein n=1 Tax=Oryza meyeriana var. granulata TaxID=110450 RepID=A0A6G1CE33_9ORYZ|nr:hypothetical protein E2562_007268 [Oryza meyeriana var. granulata]
MVSGYCKKGDLEMARVIFDKMPSKNLVTWTITVSACAQKGLVDEAGKLFTQMKEASVELDVAAVVMQPKSSHWKNKNRTVSSHCQTRLKKSETLGRGEMYYLWAHRPVVSIKLVIRVPEAGRSRHSGSGSGPADAARLVARWGDEAAKGSGVMTTTATATCQVWLKQFQEFEDKFAAINRTTGLGKQLKDMLKIWCRPRW